MRINWDAVFRRLDDESRRLKTDGSDSAAWERHMGALADANAAFERDAQDDIDRIGKELDAVHLDIKKMAAERGIELPADDDWDDDDWDDGDDPATFVDITVTIEIDNAQ